MASGSDPTPLRDAGWVAKRLGISRWSVYELVKRKALPYVRLGPKRILFDEAAIERFIAAGGSLEEAPAPSVSLRLSRRS